MQHIKTHSRPDAMQGKPQEESQDIPIAPSNGSARTLLPDVQAQGGKGLKLCSPPMLRRLPLSVRPARLHLQPSDE